MERAGSDDPVKVRDALEATKGLELMHATLTMDEFHNPKDKDGIMLMSDIGGKEGSLFQEDKAVRGWKREAGFAPAPLFCHPFRFDPQASGPPSSMAISSASISAAEISPSSPSWVTV